MIEIHGNQLVSRVPCPIRLINALEIAITAIESFPNSTSDTDDYRSHRRDSQEWDSPLIYPNHSPTSEFRTNQKLIGNGRSGGFRGLILLRRDKCSDDIRQVSDCQLASEPVLFCVFSVVFPTSSRTAKGGWS